VVSGSKKSKEVTQMVRNRAMCVVAVLALVMVGVGVSAVADYCYVGQSSGWINGRGDYDLIQLGLRGGVSYLLTVTVPWNADFDVMILDSEGNIVARKSSGGIGETEYLYFTPLFGGTYYAVPYSYSGNGSWTATLSRWYP
jgi:hypothetical protein